MSFHSAVMAASSSSASSSSATGEDNASERSTVAPYTIPRPDPTAVPVATASMSPSEAFAFAQAPAIPSSFPTDSASFDVAAYQPFPEFTDADVIDATGKAYLASSLRDALPTTIPPAYPGAYDSYVAPTEAPTFWGSSTVSSANGWPTFISPAITSPTSPPMTSFTVPVSPGVTSFAPFAAESASFRVFVSGAAQLPAFTYDTLPFSAAPFASAQFNPAAAPFSWQSPAPFPFFAASNPDVSFAAGTPFPPFDAASPGIPFYAAGPPFPFGTTCSTLPFTSDFLTYTPAFPAAASPIATASFAQPCTWSTAPWDASPSPFPTYSEPLPWYSAVPSFCPAPGVHCGGFSSFASSDLSPSFSSPWPAVPAANAISAASPFDGLGAPFFW